MIDLARTSNRYALGYHLNVVIGPLGRVHPAWVVLGALTVWRPACAPAFGVFIKPIESEFGWSRSALSAVAAMSLLILGASGPFVGRLADRWAPRRVSSPPRWPSPFARSRSPRAPPPLRSPRRHRRLLTFRDAVPVAVCGDRLCTTPVPGSLSLPRRGGALVE
ncbi:MAG: hypothetical protein DMD81_01945 [Candidatus Rokuibacteriota bacterium]|nr:MAG: hypothetical protein DMD81_01945 [Candidatus Rokubacteria bacterium]